ncbi:MAG: YkgJ family cysteine cluster protein [Spirochaetes bacterium]|nr:YkgJ family cysteine cluster protein [Spirochaetota bacterium]
MNSSIEGTSLHQRILALDTVYDCIEASQKAFRQTAGEQGSPLSCPPGCSTCCRGFVPDLIPIEADRIALYLLTERMDLLERFSCLEDESENLGSTCVFWDPRNPKGNCTIYPARALICRFFGFSAMVHKSGEPAFTLCRWMPSPPGLEDRVLVGRTLLERTFGAVPPRMTDLSLEVVAIDPDGAGTRLSLHEALRPAISRVSLILRLVSLNVDDDTRADDPGLQKPASGYTL